MEYRSEIDGMRALAVIPVILFHAGFSLFSGGFVGVDIFFVISGYLITSILIEDMESGRFSLVEFYERRARRILPALTVVIIFCIPFSWMWMFPDQLKAASNSLVAVGLFASNILFWQESGYFDIATESKPLLHTWSLAVEEQYYLLFPLFLIFAWRLGKKRIFWLIVAFALVSFAACEWGSRHEPNANFYLAPTRAWELFAGSIASFIVRNRGVAKNNTLAIVGLGAVLISIFAYGVETPFPSAYTILPVLGTVFLLLFAHRDTHVAKVLGARPLVAIGLISYSAYLWHQPLFAFARLNSIEKLPATVIVAIIFLNFVLAYLSWRFVENPFRNRRFLTPRSLLTLSILVLLIGIGIGLLGATYNEKVNAGWANRLNQPIEIGDYTQDNGKLRQDSWTPLRILSGDEEYGVSGNSYDQQLWFDPSDPRKRLLLVGNSHSKDMFNMFSCSKAVTSEYQLARFGCQIRDLQDGHVLFRSPNFMKADVVLIASRYDEDDITNLPSVLQTLKKLGKKTVVVKNVFEFPEYRYGNWSLIDKVVYDNRNSRIGAEKLHNLVNRTYYDSFRTGQPNDWVNRLNSRIDRVVTKSGNVKLLDRMEYIYDSQSKYVHAVSPSLVKYFFDYGHQTLAGADFFGKRIDQIRWFKVD